jgi:TrmH family RNA methyltransferase
MPDFRVVLVEPKIQGNIGAVARAMLNFGLHDLHLVRPPTLGDEAYRRAKAGRAIVSGATHHESLDSAIGGVDMVAGSTAVDTASERRFLRQSMTPVEFAAKVQEMEGTVALLFGREDDGLHTDELERCDVLVTVPTAEEGPVMNISHAAAILFYELSTAPPRRGRLRVASGEEKERLLRRFDELLEAIDYPTHKRSRTSIMFRRLLGRAVPSKWEFHALMGVLGPAVKRLRVSRD